MLILSYTRLYKVIQGYADGSIECIGIVLSIHKSMTAILDMEQHLVCLCGVTVCTDGD